MKKALVLSLVIVFGLGIAAFAGPVSGSWTNVITIDPDATPIISGFSSELTVDYTVGGWTFGSTAIFNLDAFDNLFFTADGALGAFSFKSVLDFEPETPQFVFWGNAGSISLGGMELYAITSIYNFAQVQTPDIGIGWQVGGSGSAGNVTITGNIRFNMPDYSYYIWAYGYDWFLGKMAYVSCGSWVKPYGGWKVQTDSCTAAFSGADFYIEFPFSCLDVMINPSFSCTNGFDAFNIELYNFDLGLSWLSLAEVDIAFDVTSKTVDTYIGLNLGETTCITPYISLVGNGTTIEGITLNALLLEYSFNGVTFKAGEIFDNNWYSYLAPDGGGYNYAFTTSGGLTLSDYYPGCVIDVDYDEYFGFVIDGDSCCGGAFSVYMYNWFDTSETSFFGWQETTAGIDVGIGSNTTISFDLSLMNDGVDWFTFDIEFTW